MSPSPCLTTEAGVPRGPGITAASCHWSHPRVPCGLSQDGCLSPIPTPCHKMACFCGTATKQDRDMVQTERRSCFSLWVHERKVPEKGLYLKKVQSEERRRPWLLSAAGTWLGLWQPWGTAQPTSSVPLLPPLQTGGSAVPPPQQLLTCGVWPRYTSLPHRKFLRDLCRGPHTPLWTQSASQWKTTDYQMSLMT